jgi:undecaprenyl-diphosphatase
VFVSLLGRSVEDAAVGMQVVAEGIERLEEVRGLKKLGCTMRQGFYFSRPLDDEALASCLAADEAAGSDGVCLGSGLRTLRRREEPRGRRFSPVDVSGSASKVPRQRRATDWNRLVVSGIVVTLAALRVRHPTAFERQLFTLINTLPGGLRGLFTRVYQLANLWANGLILVPALFARRWRLARDMLLAALLALVVARILGATIQEGLVRGLNVAVRLGKGPTFPFLRLSVATAVVAAAAPYLTRPLRWLGRATLAVVAPAAMYLGLAYPNDVVAALALGWGVAAAIHLAFGSPAGRPTVPQVEASLEELGVPAEGVALESRQPQGATRLAADGPGGRLRIKVLGRDETESSA